MATLIKDSYVFGGGLNFRHSMRTLAHKHQIAL